MNQAIKKGYRRRKMRENLMPTKKEIRALAGSHLNADGL